ncbi:UDP-glucose dehydrogenase family protein [Sphingobium phenoxybenzoativorans]|uniref:UDP-glucose dehydrogenase family protein n=1 Tax=Sphingobium phenoxybenzoativorans TaxID=1592790 RepID=UPI000872E43E|nr:UDP-glucose/GDP-mannose dehydrogenase family protein [Sphingobium phenoxybenzoativorans]
MKITMIGTGYVGLVSGACFADFGHTVTCVDKDESKIAAIRGGKMPIYEPGLDALVASNVAAKRLDFTTDLAEGVKGADAIFIAVGTPSRRGDGHADLTYVYAAAKEIAEALDGPAVIVTKSTVPVGTGDEVERIMREARPDLEVAAVSNPEFLREGAAIGDFKRPDRIVVGTDDPRATAVMRQIYRPLYLGEAPLIFTGRRTAELIKYAANAFLATKITFINEIADLCEAVGAEVKDVARGIGLDNRIGSKFLHAGPGYGGSCFPKDTLALIKTGQDFDSPIRIVEAVAQVNDTRKRAMGRKVIKALGGDARGKKVAILGLTFKPNTDDMRDAPSLAIVQALEDSGADICAYDPEGMEAAASLMPRVKMMSDPYDAAEGADVLVLVTEWDIFRALDLKKIAGLMTAPVLVDLRNIYPAAEAAAAGFKLFRVGGVDASSEM